LISGSIPVPETLKQHLCAWILNGPPFSPKENLHFPELMVREGEQPHLAVKR
jgi:hypothetical protein